MHSKLLTDRAVGWKLDSGLPGQHCLLSGRSCRMAPPTSSYSKAHIQVTAQVLENHRFKKAAKNRSNTLTHTFYPFQTMSTMLTQISVRSSMMQWLSTLKSSGAL